MQVRTLNCSLAVCDHKENEAAFHQVVVGVPINSKGVLPAAGGAALQASQRFCPTTEIHHF